MPSSSKENKDEWEQRVLGIALVVEEVGKFSKLAFRYPPSSKCPEKKKNGAQRHNSKKYNPEASARRAPVSSDSGKDGGGDSTGEPNPLEDNIFFTLPPQAMAKLFRSKPALCGQPMTLSVAGTIFCCRSVLLNQSPGGTTATPSTAGGDDNASLHSRQSNFGSTSVVTNGTANNSTSSRGDSLDQLVTFSIIVAVLPTQRSANHKTKTTLGENRHPQSQSGSTLAPDESQAKPQKEFRSQNYPAIRRIHLSLSRLCAVLEREERRCQYMSRQLAMLLEIGRRGSSEESSSLSSSKKSSDDSGTHQCQWSEKDKMESMITAKPPPPMTVPSGDRDFRRAIPLHGNLASELAETYHAMERNDLAFQITPASLLTGRDGIVYINLHIAVLIEATTKRINDIKTIDPDAPLFLRPYHTILFPDVSAAELLRNILSTGSSSDGDLSQRRLEKLLVASDPFKNISEMALDAALPIAAISESAMSLIDSGACIAVPVITSSTRFACQHGAVKLMSSLRLEFAQQFSHVVPIFVLVAALTGPGFGFGSPKPDTGVGTSSNSNSNINASKQQRQYSYYLTFGDVIRYCRQAFDEIIPSEEDGSETDEAASGGVPKQFRILTDGLVTIISADKIIPGGDHNDLDNGGGVSFQSIESLLISMTTWVRSHSIIVELKDYLVAIDYKSPQQSDDYDDANVNNIQKKNKPEVQVVDTLFRGASPFAYENLERIYKECILQKYLNGSVSTQALAWRLGISSRRMEALREWGLRENLVKVVTRIACDDDDWGAS